MRNPYAHVALTYVRRPIASWPGRFVSAIFVLMAVGLLFGRVKTYGPDPRHMLLFVFFALFLRLTLRDSLPTGGRI
jgi:hypothetical protein